MSRSSDKLENFFSYRLINVIYFTCLIFCLCIVLIGGSLLYLPEKYINNSESNIKCSNGAISYFSEVKIYPSNVYYFWKNNSALSYEDKKIAQEYCYAEQFKIDISENHKKRTSDWEIVSIKSGNNTYMIQQVPQKYQNKSIIFTEENITYTIFYTKAGKWATYFKVIFLGSLMVYIFLNIAKEAFIYLFLGRKFRWNWLKFRKNTEK